MKRKALSELTLLDKFLFDQTMDVPEAHTAALQIILGQDDLKLLTEGQSEKEVRTAPWLRSIRLDVYAVGDDGTVYDTEMQAGYRDDLVTRSRYYQSLIDSSLLEPGTISFNELNRSCIIMITPFDLFGKGKYCYTFRPRCDEDTDLVLEDKAVRIFLNTKGTNDQDVRRELIDFLHYIECVDGTFAEQSGSEKIRKIHDCVSRIKASETIGVKYMQTWEEKIIIREEGREEAYAASVRNLMLKLNLTVNEALDMISVPVQMREKCLRLLGVKDETAE